MSMWLMALLFKAVVYGVGVAIRAAAEIVSIIRGLTLARLSAVVLVCAFLVATGNFPPALLDMIRTASKVVGLSPRVLRYLGFAAFAAAAFEGLVVLQTRSEVLAQVDNATLEKRRRHVRRVLRRRTLGSDSASDTDGLEDETTDDAKYAEFVAEKYSHATDAYPGVDPYTVLTQEYDMPDIVAREVALCVHYVIRDFVGSWYVRSWYSR